MLILLYACITKFIMPAQSTLTATVSALLTQKFSQKYEILTVSEVEVYPEAGANASTAVCA